MTLRKDIDNVSVLFLDCQTTGATPEKGSILEMAWSLAQPDLGTVNSFILRQEEAVPRRIQKLTGISQDLVDSEGVDLQTAMQNLLIDAEKSLFLIIHYALFETRFLSPLPAFNLLPNIVCTHEISKRLLPDLPSRSMRALAGYFGYGSKEFKRSAHHVVSTAIIWHGLRKILAEQGIDDFELLQDWLQNPDRKTRKNKKQYLVSSSLRLEIPSKHGVYRFLDANDQILYVGKAKNLKARVNSYFRGQKPKQTRIQELLTQVHSIRHTVTETYLEAAVLEQQEIDRWNPIYNIAQKSLNTELRAIGREIFSEQPPSKTLGHLQESILMPLKWLQDLLTDQLLIDAIDENVKFWRPDQLSWEVLEAGRYRLRKEYLLPIRPSFRHLIYLGLLHWRRLDFQRRVNEEAPEDDDVIEEKSTELNFVWTVDRVYQYLLDSICQIAKEIWRSKQLHQLSRSLCAWQLKDGKWRVLCVEQGIILQRQTLANRSEVMKKHREFLQKKGATLSKTIQHRDWKTLKILQNELLRIRREKRIFLILGIEFPPERFSRWR